LPGKGSAVSPSLRGTTGNELNFIQKYERFVAEHHDLVLSFLNSNGLNENDFYDIVIFGFLKAAENYLLNSNLRKRYEFSTVAFKKMRDSLFKHYEKQNRQKRKAHIVSFDDNIYGGKILSLQEIISAPDSSTMDFEVELLLLELASKISKREMDIVRMKIDGYEFKEIARIKKMPVKGVKELLAGLRDVVLAVCYE